MTEQEYKWTVHLFSKYKARGILITLFSLFLIFFLAAYVNAFLAVLAVLLIFVPNMNFFLPIRYTLSRDGITVATPLNVKIIPWGEVKRFRIVNGGLVLNPPRGRSVFRRSQTTIVYDIPDIEEVRQLAEEMVK